MPGMKNLIYATVLLTITSSLWADCNSEIKVYDIKDPVDRTEWQVSSKAFFPKVEEGEKFPVMFILPSIMGESPIERSMARRLCNRKIGAIILDVVKEASFEDQVKNLNFEDQMMIRALHSFKHIMKQVKHLPGVSDRLGILGISQGALATAYISGSVSDIDTTVLIVGAGNLRGVLTESENRKVEAVREARMVHFKLETEEEYRALLRKRVPHDPLSVASKIKPDSTYFFMGTEDSTVPTQYQRELFNKIRGAKLYEMKAAHIEAILKTVTFNSDLIFDFLADQLDLDVEVVAEIK